MEHLSQAALFTVHQANEVYRDPELLVDPGNPLLGSNTNTKNGCTKAGSMMELPTCGTAEGRTEGSKGMCTPVEGAREGPWVNEVGLL